MLVLPVTITTNNNKQHSSKFSSTARPWGPAKLVINRKNNYVLRKTKAHGANLAGNNNTQNKLTKKIFSIDRRMLYFVLTASRCMVFFMHIAIYDT